MKDAYLIENISKTAKVLAEMLSPQVETVIHDLRKTASPIIAIYNSHISGRSIGDASPPLFKKLNSPDTEKQIINYTYTAPNGKALKSSTILYPCYTTGTPIIALSINFDTHKFKHIVQFLSHFIDYKIPKQTQATSSLSSVSCQDVENEIFKTMIDLCINTSDITRAQKKQIVQHLHHSGQLQRHGFITEASKVLKITRATIYKYIKH